MKLNLPNILAALRVLIAPIMFWLLIDRNNPIFEGIHHSWIDYAAAVLFVLAATTDFFDGFIARAWNQKTTLGGILDPLADKMLTLAAFLGLMLLSRASPWIIYLILIREFFITGLRVAAASEGKEVIASMSGKVKTVFQMIAVGFLIMDWRPLGDILLWIALILTLYSGFEYILNYTKGTKKC
ncbi:MAG: CDP-diacylglycerol--glycerol-3-phosphate 3-phosphatidyltransferase [Campylobacteraceae bacterium]|jgi:CDP-diacylglycerol--glycerol-3-phosphate 3-phosphatidyltransferase|nr:CDP-diacylglycerol--glycerol-3-phosphate 3-phosphatidyltransferase [Campylobacteraceae bacterium]